MRGDILAEATNHFRRRLGSVRALNTLLGGTFKKYRCLTDLAIREVYFPELAE